MSLEGYERKESSPVSGYLSGIYMEGLRKVMKIRESKRTHLKYVLEKLPQI
jgi:hypothetical protein